MAKRKANSALTKITTRAKAIYKSGGTWKAAIKQASREYNGGARTKVKRAAPKRKATRKRSRTVGKVDVRQQQPIFGGARLQMVNGIRDNAPAQYGSMADYKRRLVAGVKYQLSSALLKRDLATTKRERSKLTKQIRKIRANLKKYMN